MVQKAHLLSKFILLVTGILSTACNVYKTEQQAPVYETIANSKIPNSKIYKDSISLKLANGVYFLNGKPYSGYILEQYSSDTLKTIATYLEGKKHGTSQSFFPNGKLESERNYKNGSAYGRHLGYWQNGHVKFNYTYFNDQREGLQEQWYESGQQYYALNFSKDKEHGMQKAWRENGKLYINYEVKKGVRYGMQKAALCYTLKDGKIK